MLAANIRTLVAQKSGKHYLDNKTQEDTEEFLRALDTVLSKELESSKEFAAVRDKHWGKERITRRFQDNTEDGRCCNCDQYPNTKDQPFLLMSLNIPRTRFSLSISTLIQSPYSESSHVEKMKCSICCPRDNVSESCPLTGVHSFFI